MTDYEALTRQIATQEGINPNLFAAQIKQESGFNPNALSSAGAEGIAQFMPGTAKGLGINPWDPTQALKGAADLMRSYIAKYGGWPQALAAYNAGPNVLSTSGELSGNPNWESNIPRQTQDYIQVIMQAGGGAINTAAQMFNFPSCGQDSSQWYCFPVTQAHGQNGEAGVDIGTPMGTKLTAPFGGTVVGAGYHDWGGEVDILANVPGLGTVEEYFIHLDQIAGNIVPGSAISAGQFIGLSGGQTSGGSHPVHNTPGNFYSSGPHTEFGFNPPWVNLTGVSNTQKGIDPTNILGQLKAGQIVSDVGSTSTGGTTTLSASTGGGDCAAQGYVPIFQIPQIGPIGGGNICLPLTVQQTQQGLIRTGLVVLGAILVLIGFFVFINKRPNINVSLPQPRPSSPTEEGETNNKETEETEEAGPTEEEAAVI